MEFKETNHKNYNKANSPRNLLFYFNDPSEWSALNLLEIYTR